MSKVNNDYGEWLRVPYLPTNRWPPNVAHDGSDEVLEAFAAFGERAGATSNSRNGTGTFDPGGHGNRPGPGDTGSAARFFYCGKAARGEREAGLEGVPLQDFVQGMSAQAAMERGEKPGATQGIGLNRIKRVSNNHPTVKPVALMRWLVRLVTPPGGTVLDPFAGSGTTGCACAVEGAAFLGIEKEPDYVRIAEARLAHWRDVEGPRIRRRKALERSQSELPVADEPRPPSPTQEPLLEGEGG